MRCLSRPFARGTSRVARGVRGTTATSISLNVLPQSLYCTVLSYLVEVDDGLPELILQLVEVPHADFAEVTRMVLVHVGAVVVLTTGQTTTTGMLPVLADTTMTGRDVTAAVSEVLAKSVH